MSTQTPGQRGSNSQQGQLGANGVGPGGHDAGGSPFGGSKPGGANKPQGGQNPGSVGAAGNASRLAKNIAAPLLNSMVGTDHNSNANPTVISDPEKMFGNDCPILGGK